LGEAIDYVKTDLMPDFDFDAFNHEYPEGEGEVAEGEVVSAVAEPVAAAPVAAVAVQEAPAAADNTASDLASEEVDKW
jgi:hypothetical protein